MKSSAIGGYRRRAGWLANVGEDTQPLLPRGRERQLGIGQCGADDMEMAEDALQLDGIVSRDKVMLMQAVEQSRVASRARFAAARAVASHRKAMCSNTAIFGVCASSMFRPLQAARRERRIGCEL
jgi:hypothetical protein